MSALEAIVEDLLAQLDGFDSKEFDCPHCGHRYRFGFAKALRLIIAKARAAISRAA